MEPFLFISKSKIFSKTHRLNGRNKVEVKFKRVNL